MMERKALTKKQLEELGFKVTEQKLKTKTKVEIEYEPWGNNHIDTFYHYPSFGEIIDHIVSNVRQDERDRIKAKITNKLFQ
jgi:hypothetical protein